MQRTKELLKPKQLSCNLEQICAQMSYNFTNKPLFCSDRPLEMQHNYPQEDELNTILTHLLQRSSRHTPNKQL